MPSADRRRVWPAAGYALCVSFSPCRVCDTGPSIVARLPSRLLGRSNDQTFATLSAVRYGLVRRIGFLFMPPMSCIGGSLPATVRLIGRSVSQIWLEKSRSRAPLRRKSNKARGACRTPQQSYPCAVEIVISPFIEDVLGTHPESPGQDGPRQSHRAERHPDGTDRTAAGISAWPGNGRSIAHQAARGWKLARS